METIEIPNLDDDDDDIYAPPSFGTKSFGFSPSSSSLPDVTHSTPSYPTAHRSNPSSDNLARPGPSTPARPHLSKGSASYSVGIPTPSSYGPGYSQDEPRLGKFSNGSNTSLVTAGTSIGSTPGFLAARKGSKPSLTSIRNAFKSSAHAVPPVPHLNGTAYPALKNPFSRYNEPVSPSRPFASPRGGPHVPRKSTASVRSVSARSATSQSSRPDDQVPALPPIPSRSTPSRTGRHGSDAGSIFAFRRHGSVGGLDGIDEGHVRTAGEEALRVVWREFREAADGKVARVCGRPLNTHPSLAAYIDTGIDPAFDTLITSLANCARRHARRVVDLLNGWCQSHTEGINASEVRAHLDRSLGLQMRVEDAAAILTGRKSSAARFILNRALIELLKVTPKESVSEDLGMLLEQNAFNAYRSEKPEESNHVPHRKAVSQLQVELLGYLSTTRFLTVSDRFTRELGKYASAAQPTKEAEIRIEHLLRGMRHLKLRMYPEDELEMSAEFMQQLAAFFSNAHGQNLKCAYAETLTSLLHPVIETATAEVNHPVWAKAVAVVLSRALTMAQKPRYWSTAFPLVVVSLGVSPKEVFLQNWSMCIEVVTARLKDRTARNIAMNCFTRLLWIYLNRCSESSTSTRKRLDPLLRATFSSTGGLFPADMPPDPFVQIFHFVMTRQLDYGEEFVKDFLRDGQDQPGQADRATALVRAIGVTLRSIELEKPASWPQSADFTSLAAGALETSGDILPEDVADNQDVADLLKACTPALSKRIISCDRAISHLLLSNDAVSLSAHSSSSAMEGVEVTTRKHGDVYVSYSSRFDPLLRLHAAALETIPRTIGDDGSFAQIANVLSRGTFSADPNVCAAASDAMRRYAQQPAQCLILANTYLQFVFETRHVFRDTFVGSRLLDSQFERVVRLWLDILKALVGHQRIAATQEEGTVQGVTPALIDKIDGVALFLLSSNSVSLRRLAAEVMAAARDLEGQQRRPSAAFRYSRISPDKSALTRVIQIYETTVEESETTTLRTLPWCTSSDRHRLDLATSTDRVKLLRRVAESDHPKDGLLWLSIMPYFVGRVLELLPGPANDLRGLVVSTVLRLQGHVASIASLSASRATPGMRSAPATVRTSSDTAVLADYWRSYLAILCVTMPSQNTVPATPPVQRTKEAVILTPDTINTPALLHYLTSLLTWEDPRFKDAAVNAMGAIPRDLFRPLSEILLHVIRRLADAKPGGNPRDTRRSTVNGPLWTSLAHVFRLISPLILDADSSHHTNLSSMIGFTKLTHTLLSDRAVKEDFDLQSLRRSFCIVVENLTNALGKLDASDRFLGEDMRGAIFKLCYEWCHVGRRPDVAKARESQTLQAAAEGYRGERDRAQYLDDLQAKTKLLSAAAAEAMAGLCQGKLISSIDSTPAVQASEHIVDPLTVLRWIRGMFSSSSSLHHETGRKALHALLKHNWRCERLLDEVLHQSFGEGEHFSLDSSFFGVVADVITEGSVELPIHQLACLALSKLGHPVTDIRLRAFQLSLALDGDFRGASTLLPAIGSAAPNVYRRAQMEMSERLAEAYPENAADFLVECTTRLSQLEAPRRQATLGVLPAWVGVFDLQPDSEEADLISEQQKALSNLMYLAIRFADDHLDAVRDIFLAFAGQGQGGNTTALVKFLFEQGGKRKSPEFVGHAQRIMACLAQSDAGDVIFEEICSFVEPAAMASLAESDADPSPAGSLANLDALMAAPSARSQAFSTGQLALLFAGELLPYRVGDNELLRQLPTLLHLALVHVDNAGPALREQSQAVLFQVLRSWITSNGGQAEETVSAMRTAEHKLAILSRARATTFWRADDTGGPNAAFLSPPKMTTLIMRILGVLLPLHPRVKQVWGELALSWATSCPIRHLACRSFQVFRVLSPKVSPRMVSDTLARLSSTIASASPEIQAFNLEVLRTFAAITQDLTMADMRNHPQIFWCSVACLTTPYEDEFAAVIELLSHVLDKTNLSDPAVVAHLTSFRPVDWVGPLPHLQTLLLTGLRSSKTNMLTFDLIRRLASCGVDDLVDAPEERILHGFVAALPWMLHSTDLGEPNEDLGTMALDLAALAGQMNPSLGRLLTSFAHHRFRSKDDFIRQAASILRDYMSSYALDIVTLLLGFVLNTNDWMREKSMQVLKLVLTAPDARAQIQTHGNELLQPLLRLVSTKHSAQALDVLDLPVTSDSPLTGEIFGPISASGWSVPSAKEASALTRENVTAVFNTCAQETRAASAHFSVVQFADIRAFNNPSQLSLDIPSPPATASIGHTGAGGGVEMEMDNASMGDLVGALHSLNMFFDDGLEEPAGKKGHWRLPSGSSNRRVGAILARDTPGKTPSISSPIYENPYPPAHSSRHKHNPSQTTSSSISSMGEVRQDHRGFYQATPSHANSSTPSYPNSSTNLSIGANANGNAVAPGQHRAQQSYSSMNTDGDGAIGGYGGGGYGGGGYGGTAPGQRSELFNLAGGDASNVSVSQSVLSEGSVPTGSQTSQSTPIGGRRHNEAQW